MTTSNRKGIISFSITDRGALYSSYMSFVENGALFVPTSRNYELGDEVFMLLKLMDDINYKSVTGTVAWVTPTGAQGNKVPGIGIQFSDSDNAETRSGIEQHLAAAIQGERPTQTM
jgi:type IV pilus assembly protein PilZ